MSASVEKKKDSLNELSTKISKRTHNRQVPESKPIELPERKHVSARTTDFAVNQAWATIDGQMKK
jgi:hypothetical protein